MLLTKSGSAATPGKSLVSQDGDHTVQLSLVLFRWQKAAESVDPRYVGQALGGSAKHGLHAAPGEEPDQDNSTTTSMEKMKTKWNI